MTKRIITSCFGLGFLPLAPGTWGSIPVVLIFSVLCGLGTNIFIISFTMLLIAFLSSIACILFAPEVIKATAKEDPREVVVDEVAGQAITYIAVCASGLGGILLAAFIGFAAFRLFDIIKPWPCKKLERFPAGFGILADDLMAGIYAAAVLQICIHVFIG